MYIKYFMTFIWCRTLCYSTNKWIRNIPFENSIEFSKYHRSNYFTLVATGKKTEKLELKFQPEITKKLYSEPREWIYLFTVKNHIVKIGGTRVGLRGRISSYLAGRYSSTSTTVSSTNAFVYNTLDYYLGIGYPVELYAYALPIIELAPIQILDYNKVKIRAQTYNAYETIFLEDFKKKYGIVPCLNYNWDPNYKI